MDKDWKKHVILTAHQDVCAITNPLKAIGIDGFFFMRFFDHDKYINLATDLYWTEYFLVKYHACVYDFEIVKNHMFLDRHLDIWSLNPGNQFFRDAQDYAGVKDGLTISSVQKSCHDIFGYYIKSNNKLNAIDMINLIDLLRNFSDYFVIVAQDILRQGNKNPLIVPVKYQRALHERKPKYLNFNRLYKELSQEDPIFYSGFKLLTPQEIRCIYHAKNGLSAIDIADKLKLSPRTVESYLMNARIKTNSKNLIDLVSRYQEARIFL